MDTFNLSNPTIFNSSLIYNGIYSGEIVNETRPDANNTILIDQFVNPNIFNIFLEYEKELKSNFYVKTINKSYEYRPDKIANEEYNNQLLYPAILICNDLCSIMQFRIDALNYECKVPTQDILNQIISKL